MIDNSFDLGNGYVKFQSKIFDGSSFSKVADSRNLNRSQFGLPVSFARLHRTMFSFVVRVLFASSPCEVAKSVVEKVSVQMPRFLLWRAWAAKGFENEAVNCFVFRSAIGIDKYRTVVSYLSRIMFGLSFSDFPVRKKSRSWTTRSTTHYDPIFTDAVSGEARTMTKVLWWWW